MVRWMLTLVQFRDGPMTPDEMREKIHQEEAEVAARVAALPKGRVLPYRTGHKSAACHAGITHNHCVDVLCECVCHDGLNMWD